MKRFMVIFFPEQIILHKELQDISYKLLSQLDFILISFQLGNIFLMYLQVLV